MGKMKKGWYSLKWRGKGHYFRPISLNPDYMVSLCGYVCSNVVLKSENEGKCKNCLKKVEIEHNGRYWKK